MALFDLDAYEAALERPEVTLNGKSHKGEILSIEQYLPFSERFERLLAGDLSKEEELPLYREYLRAVFPRKVWYKWRGDPVDQIMKSPALVPTIARFFVLQVTAIYYPDRATTTAMTN